MNCSRQIGNVNFRACEAFWRTGGATQAPVQPCEASCLHILYRSIHRFLLWDCKMTSKIFGFSAGSWIWTNLKNSTAHTTATSALDCFASYLFRLSIQHQLLCFQHFSAEVDQLRWKGKRTGTPGNFDWRDLEGRTWCLSKHPSIQMWKGCQ